MIFGAYANGNIGDTYQAQSVGRHLKKVRPGVDLHATSFAEHPRPFEFDSGAAYSNERTILDEDFVNSHDALIIGGGGLLASVHRPLATARWVEKIRIPIILLAVGASPQVVDKCSALVKRATWISARDEFSIAAISHLRGDVTHLDDPILCDDTYEDIRGGVITPENRLCVIPRKMNDKNEPVYQHLSGLMQDSDFVLSMFPTTDEDSGALGLFKRDDAVLAYQMSTMISGMEKASVIISQRYHGCILGLRLGIPTIGMTNRIEDTQSKINNLYDQINMPELKVSLRATPMSRDELFATAAQNFDWKSISSSLNRKTTVFRTELDRGLRKIGL